MSYQLHQGDCLETLRGMADNSVDSIVTDPPYGLAFMGKKWDYDVPKVEVWEECLRVLKPGGHLLAFAGTRTQHRMAVRIEDAGFEIRDMIAWCYASGFPKSLDVSKAIDKAAGARRAVVGLSQHSANRAAVGWLGAMDEPEGDRVITAPATEAAAQWQGWGTALKPAMEMITMARKPLGSTVAECVLAHGTGALNIDGCRVDNSGENLTRPMTFGDGHHDGWHRPWMDNPEQLEAARQRKREAEEKSNALGRWPANLILSDDPEVLAGFPNVNGATSRTNTVSTGMFHGGNAGLVYNDGDNTSAARFFYTAKASQEDRDAGLHGFDLIIHSSQLNESGLWDREVSLAQLRVATDTLHPRVIAASGASNKNATEWSTLLFGNLCMDQSQQNTTFTTKMATNSTIESKILSCFQNLLTNESTAAASFGMGFGGSRVENVEHGTQQITITSAKTESAHGAKNAALKMRLRISVKEAKNTHNTVKPTDLMRYLVRLVTPPGGTVLDPFNGSGSTGKACILEGFAYIGCELDPAYIEISRARIEHAIALRASGAEKLHPASERDDKTLDLFSGANE